MRGVGGVGPVDATGHDDVDRRLLELHRAHLHRRRVRAQQHVLGEVEGVLRRPRRVLGRVVERGEVVVLVLDLGALETEKPSPTKMSSIRRRICETRCRWPTGTGGSPGSVTSTRSSTRRAVQLGRLELRGAPLEQLLQRLAHLVGLLADRAALLGRQLADRAQRLGQLRLAAQVADPQLLQLRG